MKSTSFVKVCDRSAYEASEKRRWLRPRTGRRAEKINRPKTHAVVEEKDQIKNKKTAEVVIG